MAAKTLFEGSSRVKWAYQRAGGKLDLAHQYVHFVRQDYPGMSMPLTLLSIEA